MQATPSGGIVRVTHSREDLELATRIGLERKQEGYSPEALVLAIDEVLHNLQLSRAIVLYVQTAEDGDSESERASSWTSVLVAVLFSALNIWLIVVLFGMTRANTGLLEAILIVLGQSILARFLTRAVRLAFMSACDALNDASYPTNLHPLRHVGNSIGSLRLRRLRALVQDTSNRLREGATPENLRRELAEVNLTERAADFVVRLARLSASVREYVPPYENRWLGWTLAIVFVVTCIVFIERTGDRLAEGYRNYAIALSGWIAGDIAARPRRFPRSPAS